MLIVIEGIDGSGKDTQSKLIAKFLDSNNIDNIIYSFPAYGETESSALISSYLNGKFGKLDDIPVEFATMIYSLDRFEKRADITGSLYEGKVVIADRYVSSNFAHQAAKLDGDNKKDEFISWVKDLEFNRLQIPQADKIFLLNIPPHITSDLILKKSKRSYTDDKKDMHEKDLSYQTRVYNEYLRIAKLDNWSIIDCLDTNEQLLTPEEIFAKISVELFKLDLGFNQ